MRGLSKDEREVLKNKYGGKCAYCGDPLVRGWHADHIEPIVRNWTNGTCEKPENENKENYNPACASCNIQKSSLTLEQFREKIQQFVQSLNLYSNQYKIAKKYGLIKEEDVKVRFYFEAVGD